VACRHREFKTNVNVRTLTVISMFEFTCCDSEPAGAQESDDGDRKKCCARTCILSVSNSTTSTDMYLHQLNYNCYGSVHVGQI